MSLHRICAVLLCAAWFVVAPLSAEDNPPPNPWPQWRGPRRDNVSLETGLLKEWPEGGPPLLWEIQGIGKGIAAVAVAGGRIYVLGYIGDSEYLTALDERTCQRLWASRVGANQGEMGLMRWLGQRTPTVDGDRVYAFHNRGHMVCFETQAGKELWRKDYAKEFGMRSGWGLCDRPLVDGEMLICTPGGSVAAMVALNKRTGEIIWKSRPLGPNAAHSATVVSEAGGVRQYIGFVMGTAAGVRAADGEVLWTYKIGMTGHAVTPIVWKDSVFLSSGYQSGFALLNLIPDHDGGIQTEVKYASRSVLINTFQDSGLMLGNYLYAIGGPGRFCLEVESGKVQWTEKVSGRSAGMTYADGHLYFLTAKGTVELAEATPEKFMPRSSFEMKDFKSDGSATNPVVANGRLYLRNDDRLFCHDVRALGAKSAVITLPPPASADVTKPLPEVYVPTPQIVVDKMLEIAGVRHTDVVYDLGSGDGRFVVTATKKYGCKAVGYEIDGELVKLSKQNIEAAGGISQLASIEQKDVLALDLSKASVVTLYFSESFLGKLRPQLDKLKPGSRIVSHQFVIPGTKPEEIVKLVTPNDGVEHSIYLWTTPLVNR